MSLQKRVYCGILLFMLCVCVTHAQTEQLYELNLSNVVRRSSGQAVLSLKIEMGAASIEELSGFPAGWTLTFKNDPSAHVVIEGGCSLASCALREEDISRIKIRFYKREYKDLTFTVQGEVDITRDFVSSTKRLLDSNNFHVVIPKTTCPK